MGRLLIIVMGILTRKQRSPEHAVGPPSDFFPVILHTQRIWVSSESDCLHLSVLLASS